MGRIAPRTLRWLPGQHMQPHRPEIVRALVTTVLERMERGVAESLPVTTDTN